MNILKSWFKYVKMFNHNKMIKFSLFFGLSVVLFLAMYSNVQPEKLELTLFSKAEKDILSPITIQDEEATIQKQQEALSEVEDQYVLKTEYAQNRIELLSVLFDSFIQIRELENKNAIIKDQQKYQQQLNEAKEKIPADFQDQLTYDSFLPLLNATEDQLETARNVTITAVRRIMNEQIRFGDEGIKKLEVAKEINSVNLSADIRESMTKIAQHAIIPNYVYDIKGTEVKRQQMIESIMPVMIRTGQVIVKEGQIIDREIYRQLELIGLLNQENSVSTFIGLGLFIMICIGLIAFYFEAVSSAVRKQNTYLFIYVIVFSLTIILMKAISLFQQLYTDIAFVVPVAMATILIKMLINERMAILTSIIMAFCGSIIFNDEVLGSLNFLIGIYFFFSSIASILFLDNQNHRTKILKVGFAVALVNMLVVITLTLLTNGILFSIEFGFHLLLAFLSGVNAAVLTLGLMPFFEAGFGILSTMKLIELANPNHPLLRKILTEAPGTYHHSIMVGNLSEAACEAIGANGFLARVGSYYHDLGKTKRPHFFIENQMNMENPHDKIAPKLSHSIITAHPYDGAKLLRENKIPKEIVDIAEEHHGTTLLKYFYHKAKEKDDSLSELEFRYPGPKAKTKESAIVGIADSVEAAVRSLRNPTPQKIEALVKSIISDRIQDGQFDECDITIKELDQAANSMCETLKGIFHSRIEYPEIVKKKVKEA